jgi:hypothetical protein
LFSLFSLLFCPYFLCGFISNLQLEIKDLIVIVVCC